MRSDPADFDLVSVDTLPDALDLLSANESWRPFAGGTDLMVLFNAGRLPYQRFVGVEKIPELRGVHVTEDVVAIGAATTYREIRHDPVLQSEFPLLCQSAGLTGGPANQNRGTLGGNIANASPAADSAPMLLVYDAQLEIASKRETRCIPYTDFHLAYRQTQLGIDELITNILLPRRKAHREEYARKIGTRKAQAISKVCFAGSAEINAGTVREIRVAVGSVAPIPLRCFETERVIQSQTLTPQLIDRACQTLLAEISPISDIRSTETYRAQATVNQLEAFLESLL